MSIPAIEVAEAAQPLLSEPDAYLAELLNRRQALNLRSRTVVDWLEGLRDRACAQVRRLTVPTARDEEWRFTDLSFLQRLSFEAPELVDLTDLDIQGLVLPEAAESRLVFVNGRYSPHLSSLSVPPGSFIGSLAELQTEPYQSRIQDYLAQQPGAEELFTALNSASFTDAAVVWVARNQVIETPIQLLFISAPGQSAVITQPRCLVVAEPGSVLTLIEDYVSLGEGAYFTNGVTEICLAENAQVNHTRIQRDSGSAVHVGKTAIAQARSSRYTCNALSLGARLSRHNLEVFQTGEQTETTLNGLTAIAGEQLADTHSLIAYTKPYGISHQLHKCIIGDRARAVFNGKILVPQAAQLTDAAQLNRNLLLSPRARVDTKPQLEIVADNVKCSHGATVSQLDAEEVFYLKSRGLDNASARSLLIRAFAAEVIDQIPVVSLRSILTQLPWAGA